MPAPAKAKLTKLDKLPKDALDTPSVSMRDYINMMFKAVYRYIDDLREYINKRFDGVDKRLDDFKGYVDKRFDDFKAYVDKRFDALEQRLSRMGKMAITIWAFSMTVVGAVFGYMIMLMHDQQRQINEMRQLMYEMMHQMSEKIDGLDDKLERMNDAMIIVSWIL